MHTLPRRIGKALVAVLCGMALLYVLLISTLHIPALQRKLANALATELSTQLATTVEIGSVNLGFLNRLTASDILLRDNAQQPLLRLSRISVTLNPLLLLRGDVQITTLQLFGLQATLSRPSPEEPLNCQFLLDALTSPEEGNTSHTSLRLAIRTLLVRHADISYSVLTDTLPPLHIRDLALTASLYQDTADTLSFRCKRLSFSEERTGLQLQNLQFALTVVDDEFSLSDLTLAANYFSLTAAPSTLDINDFGLTRARLLHPTLTLQSQLLDTLLHTSISQPLTVTAPIITLAAKTWKADSLTATLPEPLASLSTNATLSLRDSTLRLTDIDLQAHPALLASLLHKTDSGLGDTPYTLSGQAQLSPTRTDISLALQTPEGALSLLSPTLSGAANIDLQATSTPTNPLNATAQATIQGLNYNNYTYPDIHLDAQLNDSHIDATLATQGTDIDIIASLQTTLPRSRQLTLTHLPIDAEVSIHRLDPHALHLTDSFPNEQLSAHIALQVHQPDITLTIDSLLLSTPETQYHLHNLTLCQSYTPDTGYSLTADGDFIELAITTPTPLLQSLAGRPQGSPLQGRKMAGRPQGSPLHGRIGSPLQGGSKGSPYTAGNFSLSTFHFSLFTLHLTDAAILRHLLPIDLTLKRPLQLQAYTVGDSLSIHLTAPELELSGANYQDITLTATRPVSPAPIWAAWNGTASLTRNTGTATTSATISAQTHQDTISTTLQFQQQAKTNLAANIRADILLPTTQNEHTLTAILQPSTLTAADTLWHISPARIDYLSDGRINIDHLNIASTHADRALSIHGALAPQDTLSITLQAIQIPYITDLVDFTAVSFLGDVSGTALLTQADDGTPDFSANLTVPNFHFETAPLGSAHILASYDPTLPGIQLNADIVDTSDTIPRRTTCQGYVAPANNDILLHITAQNTKADFLEDYLGSIFSNMRGQANGYIDVVGPLSEVNLIGDMSTDVTMTLRPTNVTYHVSPLDTIRLRPYAFLFNNITLSDNYGGTALCNGQVTHRNVKNFTYTLDARLNSLLAYSEHQFNADKFMGDVTVDGSLHINGSDGHPLHINADVTPAAKSGYTQGSTPSFFAYDAATPDPLTSTDFITFTHSDTLTDSLSTDNTPLTTDNYSSDIYMDIAVHLNPLCDIALRMDNYDDAFIHTYGTGELLAHYHNKSPFTLQGAYYINDGSYRLYLQDLIYRDLTLQSGSSVTFNGNPFDANIHLICNHTLPAVPLSDLTADASVTSTGRAKVVCILDITGQLGNMKLDFDYSLPNETEETKQLVKSLIYTEEERNMQMVYLLALGRFYSSEYARATGQTDNSQAINSLLTSTISGQLNQMISSLIGTQSNWQFGTGISTGDYGLEDLDVEGILTGRLFNDRLLINGNFGYRDNALTQNASFIGDFDLSWRLKPTGNTFLKAYNKANDRYFTKNALNTQGIGISWQKEFEKGKANRE